MKDKSILEFIKLNCRAHPWHGIDIGENAPKELNSYIEIVPTDTIKFELDKETGLLKADRPQKYSNCCPTLYGLIPQTYAGKRVGGYCGEKTGRPNILGDHDPLDICILTERPILRGDILLKAKPIGGIRAIDGNEADDKIIAILSDDLVYKDVHDITDCPPNLIDRLCHYFLTYKESPEELSSQSPPTMEIAAVYGREEAYKIIELSQQDYQDNFSIT